MVLGVGADHDAGNPPESQLIEKEGELDGTSEALEGKQQGRWATQHGGGRGSTARVAMFIRAR